MAFDIRALAQIYQDESLHFTCDEAQNLIHLQMKTDAAQEVRFLARFVNPATLLCVTVLPVSVPEAHRACVTEYITRVNYPLLLGGFQLDLSDGELSYKISTALDPDAGLPKAVVTRLTYVGFRMFDRYLPGVFGILYGGKSAQQALDALDQAAE